MELLHVLERTRTYCWAGILARKIFQIPTTEPFTEPNAPTSRAKCLKKLRIVSRGVRQGPCFDIPGNCSVALLSRAQFCGQS